MLQARLWRRSGHSPRAGEVTGPVIPVFQISTNLPFVLIVLRMTAFKFVASDLQQYGYAKKGILVLRLFCRKWLAGQKLHSEGVG